MADLIIRVTGDVNDFKEKMGEVVTKTEDTSSSMLALAGIAAAAFAAVVEGLKFSIEKYAEQEQATNKLNLALQNQGIFSDSLVQSYHDQADELSKLTGYESAQIVSGQARLQSMIGQRDITKDMTEAALNLSAALGGDVNSGFEILGRAIDGNVRGLKQFGITIDDHLTKEERTKEILEKVGVAFGGLAAKTNEGLGSFKGLKTAIGEFAADLGEGLAPSVTGATGYLTEFFQTLHDKSAAPKNPLRELNTEIEELTIKVKDLSNYKDVNFGLSGITSEQQVKEDLNNLEMLKIKKDDLEKAGRGKGVGGQDPEKKKAADRQAREESERNNYLVKSKQDAHRALLDEEASFDAEIVKLQKEQSSTEEKLSSETNARKREELKFHLEQVKAQLKGYDKEEAEEEKTLNEEILANDKYYQALSLEEKEQFKQKNQAIVLSQIDTEKKARQKAAKAEADERVKYHNQFLQDEIKFGNAYATINKAMHSAIIQGSKTAFGNLQEMQTSHNSTLKSIGKAAAIANIIIKTAESAMEIYAGFSEIPIVGPALGVAGAAAAIAFGAEKIGDVTAAAQGGLITGGIPGVDSVHVLAQRQELIVPAQNFEEVISSVAASRGGGGHMGITISMDGKEAERVLTARQNEAKGLGIYTGN